MSDNGVFNLSHHLSEKKEENLLIKAMENFIKAGGTLENFTTKNINKIFLPVSTFLKEVKIITSITDLSLINALCMAGIRHGMNPIISDIEPIHLYNLSKWMKKGHGAQVFRDEQYKLKLSRSCSSKCSVEDVAMMRIFDQQLQEMHCLIKAEKQAASKAKTDDLDQRIYKIKEVFMPGSDYECPSKEMISNKCWELYCAECVSQGFDVPTWSATLAAQAESKYSNDVISENRYEFLKLPDVKGKLVNFGKKKIQELKDMYDCKRADFFRRNLVIGGGMSEFEDFHGIEKDCDGSDGVVESSSMDTSCKRHKKN